MEKIKIKIDLSFVLLILISIITGAFGLLANYFLAIFLHELSHIKVAKSYGYTLKHININMAGLNMELCEDLQEKHKINVLIAGVLCNFLIIVVLLCSWWICPEIYNYTSVFFDCNLVLLFFNLLPIYSLDGGKIFTIFLNNKLEEKKLKKLHILLNVFFIIIFLTLFFLSSNIFFLIISVFCISNFYQIKNNDYISSYKKIKFQQLDEFKEILFIYLPSDATLLQAFRKIQKRKYTIFYFEKILITCEDLLKAMENYNYDEKMYFIFKIIKKDS